MPKVTFTALYPEHVLAIKPHPVQTDEHQVMLSEASLRNLEGCTGVTAWIDERPIGIAGIYQVWQDRAEAWCLASEEMSEHVLLVMNKIRYVLDTVPFRRVEMVVKVHNDHGHKLAKHLGFGGAQLIELPGGKIVRADGLMPAFWPQGENGTDVVMYSRIRKR